MSLRSWVTAFREAIRSMTQSTLMSIASVATVAVSLFVLSAVVLLAVNLQFMADSVEKQVQIKVYLCTARDEPPACAKQDLTTQQRTDVITKISATSGVKQAKFLSKEEAWNQMKQLYKNNKGVLEGLVENPLRDSLDIEVTDVTQVKSITAAIAKLPGVGEVKYGQDYVDRLLTITRAVRIGGVGLVGLLIIATVLTISNTIRLAVYARRREISIMKLVGATDWYIRRPFMLEGVFLGVFGALIAMVGVATGYGRMVVQISQTISFVPLVQPDQVIVDLTVGLVLLGCFLGSVGSFLSMRRFLKV